MRKRSLFLIAMSVALAGVTHRSFGLSGPVSRFLGNSADIAVRWTPERIAGARPMPMPRVDVKSFRQRSEAYGVYDFNRGTGGLDYTSSRLIPESASESFPYSAVGKLFFSDGVDDFTCSGAVISKRLVVTAGHCAFNQNGFFNAFMFAPGFQNGQMPFGLWAANRVSVTSSWANNQLIPHRADFAILVMTDQGNTCIGDVTGWLGWKTKRLSNNHVTMVG